jgi:hypothetical protein
MYPILVDDIVVPMAAHVPAPFAATGGGFRVIQDKGSEVVAFGVPMLSQAVVQWTPATWYRMSESNMPAPTSASLSWTTIADALAGTDFV